MKRYAKPIIGILGGMGPYATIDFIKNIYDKTQDVVVDSDHIRIITDINITIPSRTRCVLYGEASPVPAIVESINNLSELGVSIIAVPCNSAHYFYDEIVQQLKCTWLNMIEVVSSVLNGYGCSKPLILGGYVTVSKELYSKYIPNSVYFSEEENLVVYRLIEEIKLSSNNYSDLINQIITNIRRYNIDSIVLACTELTIIEDAFNNADIIIVDSSIEYAKKLIEFVKSSDEVEPKSRTVSLMS